VASLRSQIENGNAMRDAIALQMWEDNFVVHVYHSHKEPSRLVTLFVFLKKTSVWFSLRPDFVQLILS
jgi:hypothetical protein